MKIDKYGKFILYSHHFNPFTLNLGSNLISIKGDNIFLERVIKSADAACVINIQDDSIFLVCINGNMEINNCKERIKEIRENTSFSLGNHRFTVKFVCEDTKIEALIDMFMNGNLDFPLDMDQLFYKYANILKITDIKAISNVMAAIDIPEIDKF